jgi:hypothetical protein
MAWLSGWAADQRFELTIDHNEIPATLLDFPVLIKLTEASGTNEADVTDLFDKLAIADFTEDDFTGNNGDPPDPAKWIPYSSSRSDDPVIDENRLKMDSHSGTDSRVDSLFTLNGDDIEIQIDFEYGTGGDPNSTGKLELELRIDDSNFIQINRTWGDLDQYEGISEIGGSVTSNSVATTDDTGQLRVRRVGTTWYADYWNGSGWTNLHSGSGCPSADLFTRICVDTTTFDDLMCYADNFVITTGTLVYSENPNRRKIAVTGSDGTTEQKVEIEYFFGELAFLHTKVPSISASVDTILYLYYDAAHADNTANVGEVLSEPAKAVWNSNFVSVYHHAQVPAGSNSILDSTVNLLHGDPEGSMLAEDLVDGKVGKCLEFDGSNDFVDVGPDAKFDDILMTVEAIINPTGWGGGNRGTIVSKYLLSTARGWELVIDQTTNMLKFISWRSGGPGVWEKNGVIFLSTFTHVAVTYNHRDIANDAILYVDGIDVGADNRVEPPGSQQDEGKRLRIGANDDSLSRFFNGLIDEVRISNIIRPAAWLKVTRETLFDNLISYDGPGVGAGAGVASVISNEVIHSALFGGLAVR